MAPFDEISIDPSLGTPLAEQVRQQVAWLIASGVISPGEALPSVRKLATRLAINVNTVRDAYQRLEADGMAQTRRGVATRALGTDPKQAMQRSDRLRSHTLGVILPSISNPFYHALLEGVEESAREAGGLLFVASAGEGRHKAERYVAQFSAKGVDGIILASQDPSRFLTGKGESTLPLVTVDWPGSAGHSVLLDLEGAGFQVTQHLLSHGHTRIGLITPNPDWANVGPVRSGYWRALEEAGAELDLTLTAVVESFEMASGSDGLRKLLAQDRPPTAVFAVTDVLAVGALQAAQEVGLRIPEDLALAGFNDIPMASILRPALTTASAPAREMGGEAVWMLQTLIAGRRPARKRVLLPTQLVIRDSCGVHVQP